MSVLPVGIGPQEGGYQIERSLRFNSADSAYLSRTPASAGNRKTWTWSCWIKRSKLGTYQEMFYGTPDGTTVTWNGTLIGFTNGDQLRLLQGNSPLTAYDTVAVFRDVSAWYHILVAVDTTQATSTNRVKMYVNGVQQTTTITVGSGYAQNDNTWINGTYEHDISSQNDSPRDEYLDAYLADVYLIDGQALDPTSFGEYNTDTGVWQPKAYTGSYGTNGFYLDFADNSSTTALGYDAAGSNDWTPNNFSVTAGAGNDSLVDTPTPYGTDTGVGGEVRGNYATLNPLDKGSAVTLSNGNLSMASSNASYSWLARSTIALPSSGKWYWEVDLTGGTIVGHAAGIYTGDFPTQTSGWVSSTGNSYQVGFGYIYSYIQYQSGSASFANWGTNTNAVIGDKLMFAYDADNQALWVGRNGTWYNTSGTANPATNTDPRWTSVPAGLFPGFNAANPTGDCAVFNFGQRPFAYTAPSGFKALCTQNLPDPTIADGGNYFNALLYNGSASSQNITGVGFSPDLVWIKTRSGAESHQLVDQVRGATKALMSNETSAETTWTNGLSAFLSDGFTLPGGNNRYSDTGYTYVAWNWKAGGTGVSNTAGSITSTVSANTTAGFSIVTYTGTGSNATVGHGLGVAPSMVIIKSRSDANSSWIVYHSSISPTNLLTLQTTAAQQNLPLYFNSTATTSTVFSIGSAANTGVDLNVNTKNYVAYCFAPVAGYSAFGSYTGNGSSDGPMIFTGFKPAFVLVKKSSGAESWQIADAGRSPYNVSQAGLSPNTSNAENTTAGQRIDFLSNGFKPRDVAGQFNDSGATYIYAAFASNPFKYSLAV